MRSNPWLEIPARDYEGHMELPEVDQFEPLKKIFAEALEKFRPKRIAILGCATGNGIDEIDFGRIEMLHALDINPGFLEILKRRYSQNISKIETIACDLDRDDPGLSNIDLVFAALIFEYVDPETVVEKIFRWLKPNGALVVVLQRPCENIPEISPSRYKSLEKLSSIMKLVPVEEIRSLAMDLGMQLVGDYHFHKLKSGKEFCEFAVKK